MVSLFLQYFDYFSDSIQSIQISFNVEYPCPASTVSSGRLPAKIHGSTNLGENAAKWSCRAATVDTDHTLRLLRNGRTGVCPRLLRCWVMLCSDGSRRCATSFFLPMVICFRHEKLPCQIIVGLFPRRLLQMARLGAAAHGRHISGNRPVGCLHCQTTHCLRFCFVAAFHQFARQIEKSVGIFNLTVQV